MMSIIKNIYFFIQYITIIKYYNLFFFNRSKYISCIIYIFLRNIFFLIIPSSDNLNNKGRTWFLILCCTDSNHNFIGIPDGGRKYVYPILYSLSIFLYSLLNTQYFEVYLIYSSLKLFLIHYTLKDQMGINIYFSFLLRMTDIYRDHFERILSYQNNVLLF